MFSKILTTAIVMILTLGIASSCYSQNIEQTSESKVTILKKDGFTIKVKNSNIIEIEDKRVHLTLQDGLIEVLNKKNKTKSFLKYVPCMTLQDKKLQKALDIISPCGNEEWLKKRNIGTIFDVDVIGYLMI